MSRTWDTIMGTDKTLVDLLALINPWNIAQATVDKVKSVANDVLDGIKAGVEFIANAVLGPLIDSIVVILSKLLETFSYIADEFLSAYLDIQVYSDKIVINGKELSIKRDSLQVVFNNDEMKYTVDTIFLTPFISYETLSPADTAGILQLTEIFMFASTGLAMALATQAGVGPRWELSGQVAVGAMVLFMLNTLVTYLSVSMNWNQADKDVFYDHMITFYAAAATGFAVSLLFGSISKKLELTALTDIALGYLISQVIGIVIPQSTVTPQTHAASLAGIFMFALGAASTFANPTALPFAARQTNFLLLMYSLFMLTISIGLRS